MIVTVKCNGCGREYEISSFKVEKGNIPACEACGVWMYVKKNRMYE